MDTVCRLAWRLQYAFIGRRAVTPSEPTDRGMKRLTRMFLALVGFLGLILTGGNSHVAIAEQAPALFGDQGLKFPAGEPGKLSVVLTGPPQDNGQSVMVVVRNNTMKPAYRVEVTSTARKSGKLVGSGSSQGFAPVSVAPGQVAVGYVYFGGDIPKASVFQMKTSAEGTKQDTGSFAFLPVTITEVASVKGTYTAQVVGTLKNVNKGRVTGPISVLVACFSANGAPLQILSTFAQEDELAAAATGSFAADLFSGGCPRYLAGAHGFKP